MALERNTTELPAQHKAQNYRAERSNNNSTAKTNEGLNPHNFTRCKALKEATMPKKGSTDK